ncbi:hypothetical protein [Rathayibacter sp. TRS19]|uniref:hypothetical protein n=1 Tax=unclassified Rathayibacter TaxID=2609250 RepID=UPI0035BE25BA
MTSEQLDRAGVTPRQLRAAVERGAVLRLLGCDRSVVTSAEPAARTAQARGRRPAGTRRTRRCR